MTKKKKRPDTARLRKINDSAKEAAEVIAGNSSGRPAKYHEHFVLMVNTLAAGLVSSTNYQLAAIFGVQEEGTIERWMQLHPSFKEAINRARARVDQEVERALYERAVGYRHKEEKIFCAPRTGEIVRATTEMQYPPEPKALIFWLGNRHPDKWKQRTDRDAPQIADPGAAIREAVAAMDQSTIEGESK